MERTEESLEVESGDCDNLSEHSRWSFPPLLGLHSWLLTYTISKSKAFSCQVAPAMSKATRLSVKLDEYPHSVPVVTAIDVAEAAAIFMSHCNCMRQH